MSESKRKIYVVGGDHQYANWMEGTIVFSIAEADLVVFTGGEDVTPSYYGDVSHPYTHSNKQRDCDENEQYIKAVSLGKYIWGTCRGSQFLNVMNGGTLVQHMSHPGTHEISMTYSDEVYKTTSTHHQMMIPNRSTGIIIAYARGLSPYHFNGNGKDIGTKSFHFCDFFGDEENKLKEPEIVYYKQNYILTKSFDCTKDNVRAYKQYPRSSSLMMQGHPEYMDHNGKTVTMLRELLDKWMNKENRDFVEILRQEKQDLDQNRYSDLHIGNVINANVANVNNIINAPLINRIIDIQAGNFIPQENQIMQELINENLDLDFLDDLENDEDYEDDEDDYDHNHDPEIDRLF